MSTPTLVSPPPLPARKPATPLAPALPSSDAIQAGPMAPPSLPPRPAARHTPAPIITQAEAPNSSTPTTSAQRLATDVSVSVTPATPPDGGSPTVHTAPPSTGTYPSPSASSSHSRIKQEAKVALVSDSTQSPIIISGFASTAPGATVPPNPTGEAPGHDAVPFQEIGSAQSPSLSGGPVGTYTGLGQDTQAAALSANSSKTTIAGPAKPKDIPPSAPIPITAFTGQPKAGPPPIPTVSRTTDPSGLFGWKGVIPMEWALITIVLTILAYSRVSILWLTTLGVIAVVWVTASAADIEKGKEVREDDIDTRSPEAVAWVNHALHALFPLISTDVLTPFIDLLEDALAQQVPPIVTSVRITSAALGTRPMLLTSLRHLTDQEWFSTLSQDPIPKEIAEAASTTKGHAKSKSTSQAAPFQGTAGTSGSRSRSATISSSSRSPSRQRDPTPIGADLAERTENLRKRDRILRRLTRRGTKGKGVTGRTGDDPSHEAGFADGERAIGGGGELDMDEGDPNAGQYVNYQVGFEYQQPKEALSRRGFGLHTLAYFGVGVKGVGKTEMPVYIDVIAVKGTINLRLLLSATPPFVRTATFSFPNLPEFDISAKPLIRSAFNAMQLPGMRSYADVAQAFVSPASYSMDIDRLLLGREASLQTSSIGVLHIVIHSAANLPKTDTVGSCDPYVAISFSKFHKPLFSTRTIIDARDPSWEEPAFIMVSADAIKAGEKLRLRVCDSDRFSADDAMGVVEVDLAELVEAGADSSDEILDRRKDDLTADRPGMKVCGSLQWSVKFFPTWQMDPEEVDKRIKSMKERRLGDPSEADATSPWWIDWLARIAGETPKWAEDRDARRKETAAWFTGEREKDEMEVAIRPTDDLRSGIVQFHIHQCIDLEVESLEGTYSSALSRRKSAASGKPALADIVDRTPAENPDPPSAYCEVHLNDKLVYRTRTKQMTPMPYFNAVSERFIRDWRMAKIVIVVRDERDREHDPILGIVNIPLSEAFSESSQMTRWFPLVGGLGWGRIRISMLWKAVDIHLPPRVSGYEVATLLIKSITSTDLSQTDKPVSVVLETEVDRFTLDPEDSESDNRSNASASASASAVSSPKRPFHKRVTSNPPNIPSPKSARFLDTPPDTAASKTFFDFDPENSSDVDWELAKPIRLAVIYRHSCSVLISFVLKSRRRFGKKKIVGLASVRLDACPDGEDCQLVVPIFATDDVGTAIKAAASYHLVQVQAQGGEAQPDADPRLSSTAPQSPSIAKSRRLSGSSVFSIGSPRSTFHGAQLIGLVSLTLHVKPGVSRAHRKLCKKDLRFKRVYEAWEISREISLGMDKETSGDVMRVAKEHMVAHGDGDGDGSDDDDSGSSSDGNTSSDDDGAAGRTPGKGDSDDEVENEEFLGERRAHSHALHKRNKGIFQFKIARTGKFVKDKIAAKIYSGASGAGGKLDQRPRGTDLEVEQEGTSKI